MKRNTQIGLFVDEEQLQCAVICAHKHHYQIKQLFSVKIDSDNTLLALKKARGKIPFHIRTAVVALQYHQVIIKELTVDANLNDSEIYQHLKQQSVPFFERPAKTCFFDFTPIHSRTTGDGQMVLCAMAASQDIVNKWLNDCKQSGFIVCAIDVDLLALIRLLPTLLNHKTNQTNAFIWSKKTVFFCAVEKSKDLIQFTQSDHPPKTLFDHAWWLDDSLKQPQLDPDYWPDAKQHLPDILSISPLCALGLGIYPHVY